GRRLAAQDAVTAGTEGIAGQPGTGALAGGLADPAPRLPTAPDGGNLRSSAGRPGLAVPAPAHRVAARAPEPLRLSPAAAASRAFSVPPVRAAPAQRPRALGGPASLAGQRRHPRLPGLRCASRRPPDRGGP